MMGVHSKHLMMTTLLLLGSNGCFLFLLVPLVDIPYLFEGGLVISAANFIFLFLTAFTEPGIIPRRPPSKLLENMSADAREKMQYCHTCRIVRWGETWIGDETSCTNSLYFILVFPFIAQTSPSKALPVLWQLRRGVWSSLVRLLSSMCVFYVFVVLFIPFCSLTLLAVPSCQPMDRDLYWSAKLSLLFWFCNSHHSLLGPLLCHVSVCHCSLGRGQRQARWDADVCAGHRRSSHVHLVPHGILPRGCLAWLSCLSHESFADHQWVSAGGASSQQDQSGMSNCCVRRHSALQVASHAQVSHRDWWCARQQRCGACNKLSPECGGRCCLIGKIIYLLRSIKMVARVSAVLCIMCEGY